MKKKEKIRFAAASVLSLICAVCTFFVVEAAICEFMMMPSQTTGKFYLVLASWMSMIAIALLVFGIGTVCAGALAAFFAFSFRKYEGKAVRRTMKTVFIIDMVLIVFGVLALILLLF